MIQQLTNRDALLAHRARALRTGPVDVLHRVAIDEVQERLSLVNRTFTAPAIVGGWMPCWAESFPDALHVPDTPTLDLEESAHDLVVHALSLHWADDPVGQLVQARRALRPDGMMLAITFGGETLAGLRAALAEAEVALRGGLSPRVLPMGELRELGGLLARAGLSMPVADAIPLQMEYDNAFHLMAELRAMGETNALAARDPRIPPRLLFTEAASRYQAAQATETGRVLVEFEMIALTGWAPADNQPQPLRPGSAKMRLADALNTSETSLNTQEFDESRDRTPRQED